MFLYVKPAWFPKSNFEAKGETLHLTNVDLIEKFYFDFALNKKSFQSWYFLKMWNSGKVV